MGTESPIPLLSNNDTIVLSQLLSPEFPVALTTLIDPTLPPSLPLTSSSLLPTLQALELTAIHPITITSPSKPQIQETVNQLTNLIISHPKYASAYTNRAQALRLLIGDDLYSEDVGKSTLWEDLSTAIKLATPSKAEEMISEFQAQILRSAYAQRGHLIWKASKISEEKEAEERGNLPEQLRGKGKRALEEVAVKDLEMAGRYGDQEAKKMAVSANPYARLCGSIVEEAMKAEFEKGKGAFEGYLVNMK